MNYWFLWFSMFVRNFRFKSVIWPTQWKRSKQHVEEQWRHAFENTCNIRSFHFQVEILETNKKPDSSEIVCCSFLDLATKRRGGENPKLQMPRFVWHRLIMAWVSEVCKYFPGLGLWSLLSGRSVAAVTLRLLACGFHTWLFKTILLSSDDAPLLGLFSIFWYEISCYSSLNSMQLNYV